MNLKPTLMVSGGSPRSVLLDQDGLLGTDVPGRGEASGAANVSLADVQSVIAGPVDANGAPAFLSGSVDAENPVAGAMGGTKLVLMASDALPVVPLFARGYDTQGLRTWAPRLTANLQSADLPAYSELFPYVESTDGTAETCTLGYARRNYKVKQAQIPDLQIGNVYSGNYYEPTRLALQGNQITRHFQPAALSAGSYVSANGEGTFYAGQPVYTAAPTIGAALRGEFWSHAERTLAGNYATFYRTSGYWTFDYVFNEEKAVRAVSFGVPHQYRGAGISSDLSRAGYRPHSFRVKYAATREGLDSGAYALGALGPFGAWEDISWGFPLNPGLNIAQFASTITAQAWRVEVYLAGSSQPASGSYPYLDLASFGLLSEARLGDEFNLTTGLLTDPAGIAQNRVYLGRVWTGAGGAITAMRTNQIGGRYLGQWQQIQGYACYVFAHNLGTVPFKARGLWSNMRDRSVKHWDLVGSYTQAYGPGYALWDDFDVWVLVPYYCNPVNIRMGEYLYRAYIAANAERGW